MATSDFRPDDRLVDLTLDESIGRAAPDIEHERAVAIFDLIEDNRFRPLNSATDGPYKLDLSLQNGKLVFDIKHRDGEPIAMHILSLTPFKRIVQDYHDICDSYHNAIRNLTAGQIESIDMARRGIHNDGSRTLQDRLEGKVEVDFDTARRLFTLICVLHWSG